MEINPPKSKLKFISWGLCLVCSRKFYMLKLKLFSQKLLVFKFMALSSCPPSFSHLSLEIFEISLLFLCLTHLPMPLVLLLPLT